MSLDTKRQVKTWPLMFIWYVSSCIQLLMLILIAPTVHSFPQNWDSFARFLKLFTLWNNFNKSCTTWVARPFSLFDLWSYGSFTITACEWSGKWCRANQKSAEAEQSGEWALQKTMEWEQSMEREVAERELSGERAELATHSLLQPNILPTL